MPDMQVGRGPMSLDATNDTFTVTEVYEVELSCPRPQGYRCNSFTTFTADKYAQDPASLDSAILSIAVTRRTIRIRALLRLGYHGKYPPSKDRLDRTSSADVAVKWAEQLLLGYLGMTCEGVTMEIPSPKRITLTERSIDA
jgi:hypothetical protein